MEYVDEVGVALCGQREYRAAWSQAGFGICPVSVGHGDSVGQGLFCVSALEVAEHNTHGLEDGEKPDVVVKPAGAAPDADHIAAELDLCVSLAGWVALSVPSAQSLQAMEQAQRTRGVASAAVVRSPHAPGERRP